MEVKNCRGCGRLFNYLQGPQLCPSCREALEDKFNRVKQYIEDNQGASINLVSQENDVSVKQLRQWVREERLSFAEGSGIGIPCEKCGRIIRTGRFCDECKTSMKNTLQNAYRSEPKTKEAPKTTDRNRMRFLDN